MSTIVHRTKEIKNTPERIRAPVKNWNTGLPFPGSITDHTNTVNMNVRRRRGGGGGGEGLNSALVSFQKKQLPHSQLVHIGNTQILPLSFKRSAGSKVADIQRVSKVA